MISTYREAREYLEGFIPFIVNHRADPSKNPLGRMDYFLNLLDNPHKKFPSVVVSGTSGKGSVSYLISRMLTLSGYKTGLTISPHLQKITERMQINNKLLEDQEFIKLLNEIVPAIKTVSKSRYGPPSYYEILLAMAFVLFAQKKVHISIVEVGIEGRFDATNLIDPLIFVLNNISLDHIQILGNTVYKIAQEASYKIQSLKPLDRVKPFVITGVDQPSIIKLIEARCRKSGAILLSLGKDFNYQVLREALNGTSFDFCFHNYKSRFFVALRGDYQVENASMALAAIRTLKNFGFKISEKFLKTALASAYFPGRFEVIKKDGQTIILDGAHNPAKMTAFLNALERLYPTDKKIFIAGFKKDKDTKTLLKLIIKRADALIITQFKSTIDWGLNMGIKTSVVKQQIIDYRRPKTVIFEEETEHALKKALNQQKILGKKSLLIVTGSLYLVGEIRNLLFSKKGYNNKCQKLSKSLNILPQREGEGR